MNKVILMGRLTRDPEVRYSQGAQPMAIARYSLAVNRSFKREGQPDVDFINIVAFGRAGEFAEKYFKKGMQVAITGRIQTGSYKDKDGNTRYTTDVVVEEQHFAESKKSFDERIGSEGPGNYDNHVNAPRQESSNDGFVAIDNIDDDDLPF